jgi:DNA polymerase
MKGIICGFNAKKISDFIFVNGKEGWQFSSLLNRIPMINYDVMPNPPIGLKTLEGFLGSDIRETEVPFDIDRKLTQKEIEQTIFYCRHDVEQTINVFLEKLDDFNAMHGIVQAFDHIPLSCIGDSEARITAKVLECHKTNFEDEFDYFFLPCLQIKKYKYVMDWFASAVEDCTAEMKAKYNECKRKEKEATTQKERDKYMKESWKYVVDDDYTWSMYFYKRALTTDIAGIPHTFGFGGLHGATEKPTHKKGLLLHVDVTAYYPSLLIAWGLVTRAATNDNYKLVYDTRNELKKKQIKASTKAESKKFKKMQLPYKKMINALSGAMKDKTNPAYDPRNNNCMCINGQLMLLDLIEHLEVVPGFELIQSNTDGLIILIPDTDAAFEMVDDICYEWETRCSTDICNILLELDTISEIYQKDVNNYLWVSADGSVERIGAYVKELSPIDNDLPILNTALVAYMVHKTPVEQTINQCNDLMQFQKIVKLSNNYKWVEHESGIPEKTITGVRVKKTLLNYTESIRYTYKSYRVFASNRETNGRILKCGGKRGKGEKFANTPDHCFIYNDSVVGVDVPDYIDKSWYIDLANKRLKQFGIT